MRLFLIFSYWVLATKKVVPTFPKTSYSDKGLLSVNMYNSCIDSTWAVDLVWLKLTIENANDVNTNKLMTTFLNLFLIL